MAHQSLDLQQRIFVNDAVYPFLDDLVRMLGKMDRFIADYDAQQDAALPGVPIAITNDELGTDPTGEHGREDAPQPMTGTLLQAIRSNAGEMRAEVTGVELATLHSLIIRSLEQVAGGGSEQG